MSGYKGPRFDLDHLATFTVTSKRGLLHPEDGLRKLRMMNQTTGIWTMRCTMIISPQCVFIIDKQSGKMMEEFPMNLLVDPMAASTSGSDMYSNILLFTVLEDNKNMASPTEMHIFQCIGTPADQIADELKKQKNVNRSPYYTRKENGHYEPNYVRDSNPNTLARNDSHHLVAQSRQNGKKDEMTDEKVNRDVNILNHCFDDIEKFIGRIQLVAGARKELERRKKSRGKKEKTHGDGLLVMRARPPPKEEFIDVFKKFKLAFNLLARLRPFIHDPNSSELVHFLMTPLSLVVGASKDPVNEMPDVCQRIVSPLLTYEGKELLTNCLNSKEFTFWMSLGEAWTLSREQWNSFVPPYYPKFTDGWMPYSPADGPEKTNTDAALRAAASRVAQTRPTNGSHTPQPQRQQQQQQQQHRSEPPPSYPSYQPPSYQPSVYQRSEAPREYQRSEPPREYHDPLYNHLQREEFNNLQREEFNPYDIDSPARPSSPRPKTPEPIMAGYHVQTYVENPSYDRNRNYQVEETKPKPRENGTSDHFLLQLRNSGRKVYQVTHERVGRNSKELTVSKGEHLEVLDDTRNWWKTRNQQGEIGYVPFTIMKQVPQESMKVQASPSAVPAPPVPPPVLPVSRTPEKTPKPQQQAPKPRPSTNPKDDLHDELKRRMSMGTKVDGSKVLRPVSKYISRESTAEEVREWLMSKGFSQRLIRVLKGYTGIDLFSLSKQEIFQIAPDRDEAGHLDSQVLIQKNISGFDTIGASELNVILHDRKRRADLANLGPAPPFVPRPPGSETSESSDDIPTYGRFGRR